MTWIKGTGRIEVNNIRGDINNGVRVVFGFDFCRYYAWLINREFWGTIKTQFPAHGSHLTISNPKIHGNIDYSKVEKYRNMKVVFDYDPTMLYISKVNFWMPARLPIGAEIKKILNITESPHWKGDHLTVCNKKFETV